MLPALIAVLFSITQNPDVLTVPIVPVEAVPPTIPELQAMATSSAAQYHLSKRKIRELLATVNCESGWDTSVVGDHGTSVGLSQIHLPAHKSITKEMALDPAFSLDFIARQFSLHHENLWSCWENLYGGDTP